MATKTKVVVCGTKYGQIYLSGLTDPESPFELAGIIAKGSERSRRHAEELNVPLYTKVNDLPEDVRFACVVVKSSIHGGEGTNLAMELLKRKINVLQEHPVHIAEIRRCQAQAKASGVVYHVNAFYSHTEAAGSFIRYLKEACTKERPIWIQASTALTYSLADVLARGIGGLSPFSIETPPKWSSAALEQIEGPAAPFRTAQGVVAGIPLFLTIQDLVDPKNMDDNFWVMHRASVGFPSGNLTLLNTHGPVVWSRTFSVPGYEHSAHTEAKLSDRADAFAAAGKLPSAVTITEPDAPNWGVIYRHVWRDAVISALQELAEDAAIGRPRTDQSEAHHRGVSGVWFAIRQAMGGRTEVNIPPAPEPHPDPIAFRERLLPPKTSREEAPSVEPGFEDAYEWISQRLRLANWAKRSEELGLSMHRPSDGRGLLSKRLHIRAQHADGTQRRLVWKGRVEEGEVSRFMDRIGAYRREICFYEQAQAHTQILTPALLGADVQNEQLLLEFLEGEEHSMDAVIGEVRTLAAVDVLAKLHASWWQRRSLWSFDWLPDFQDAETEAMQQHLGRWFDSVETTDSGFPGWLMARGRSLLPELPAVWQALSHRPVTLLHGDFQLHNMIFQAGGEIGIVDWQRCRRGCGLYDFGYFLVTSVPETAPDQFRDRLFDRYKEGLRRHGAQQDWSKHDLQTAMIGVFMTVIMAAATLGTDLQSSTVNKRSTAPRLAAAWRWAGLGPSGGTPS